jgi:PhnB protein
VEDPSRFVAFLRRVFDARGDFEADAPSEIMIDDSRLMISGAGEREIFPAFLYVYVDDAEAAAKRAVEAGAVLLEEAWDTPYGDRRAMVKDPWGNLWQIATHKLRQTRGKR